MDDLKDPDVEKRKKLNRILKSVDLVKQKAKERYNASTMKGSIHRDMNSGKRCQWCTNDIYHLGSFCSDECEKKHDKAVEDYEMKRADKEEKRWAR